MFTPNHHHYQIIIMLSMIVIIVNDILTYVAWIITRMNEIYWIHLHSKNNVPICKLPGHLCPLYPACIEETSFSLRNKLNVEFSFLNFDYCCNFEYYCTTVLL